MARPEAVRDDPRPPRGAPSGRDAQAPTTSDWTTAGALADDPAGVLEEWLAREGCRHEGMDAKARGAALMGTLAGGIATEIARAHLAGRDVSVFSPDRVALRLEAFAWAHDGRSGVANRVLVAISGPRGVASDGADARSAIHAVLVALFAPVVRRLHDLAHLPKAALWRIVADGLAYGYLIVGGETGAEAAAVREAEAVLASAPPPLFNRQTGFLRVVSGARDEGRAAKEGWFVGRGGCCRTHTCPSQTHCLTCCLLSERQQTAGLARYLSRTGAHAGGA